MRSQARASRTRTPRLASARLLLALALALAAAAGRAGAEESVRLVLLGTAGGPTPKALRAAPATALVVGRDVYLVDAGNGVGRQMALAGLKVQDLRHVFLTHHHSDHAADLVTLPLLAWASGLDHPLVLHGPRPIRSAVRAGLRAVRFDVETRAKDEGWPRLGKLLRVHEIRKDGVVLDDGRVTVRAARVEHPPIRDAFAYRFETGGASFVVSGDTRPCRGLVELARGADVLVHEVLLLERDAVARWLEKPPDHPLVEHVVSSHTSFRDLGRVAAEAGVRKLVLTHFVPGNRTVDREAVLAGIRESYSGEVVFGEDLLVVTAPSPPR